MTSDDLDAEVLIVGGGPVGLTAALSLAKLGITSWVLEADATTTQAPKARAVNTRTMEIFRMLGVEPAMLREALPLDSWRFLYMNSISGDEWGRVEDIVDRSHTASPTYRRTIMQSHVEAMLADAVSASSLATLRYGVRLTKIEQDASSVTATLYDENTQSTRQLRGRFLIGADGTQSTTRPLMNIELPGESGLGFMGTVHHRTDLGQWLKDRPSTLIMTTQPGAALRVTGVAKGTTEWVTMFPLGEEPGTRLEDFDEDRCKSLVRDVVGVPDIDVEILYIGSFTVNFQLAAQFRKGRVFLAGDAAHRIPPAGGFGMNIGVQGAHNLAWKLAWVLRGHAGDALLDTYDVERRKVAAEVGEWSKMNGPRMGAILMARMSDDTEGVVAATKEMEKYVRNIGMDLGVRYEEGAIVGDGGAPEAIDPSVYTPSSRPGSRAPHVEIERDGKSDSFHSLLGDDFVLLAHADNHAAQVAVESCRTTLGTSPTIARVGRDIVDVAGSLARQYELGANDCVLIRPDGYVAWRTRGEDTPLPTALIQAMRQVLCRPAA